MKRALICRTCIVGAMALAGAGAPGQPVNAAGDAPAPGSQPAAEPSVQEEVNRALALMNQQKLTEAEAAFKGLVTKAPGNGQAWFGLGYCLHMRGEIDEALEAHLKAAKLATGQTRFLAIYNAGCAYALKGEKDHAFEMLHRAVLTGMRGKAQIANDGDLASLHEDARWSDLLKFVDEVVKAPPEKALLFWKGEWDVYSREGRAGSNTLEVRMGGAAIHEQGTDIGGNTGESWNYYDQAEGVWVQIWVEPSGRYTRFVGRPKEGGVWFEGEVHGPMGVESRVSMFVRPVEGGMVRQTGGRYDEKGTHEQRYDLLYVPKGATFDPASFAW
ncbi:MAG: tetratricopeptide repeat protein [Phycisphaerales bacterium]|nr:tetratricopeptide repeat protein [Phycisphaerales bacterium]